MTDEVKSIRMCIKTGYEHPRNSDDIEAKVKKYLRR